jgi:hypothetical protein
MKKGKWYLSYVIRLIVGENLLASTARTVELPLGAVEEEAAVVEAKAKWNETFVHAKSHGCEKGISEPHAVYKIPL